MPPLISHLTLDRHKYKPNKRKMRNIFRLDEFFWSYLTFTLAIWYPFHPCKAK